MDFAGITFFQNFEAGYSARWIQPDTARRLNLEMRCSGVGSGIHLTSWLSGQRHYSGLITSEPEREISRDVELHTGWDVLVFKSFHRT